MNSFLFFVLSVGCLGIVAAHGGLSNYTVGDTWYRGYSPDESPEDQLGEPWLIQRSWTQIDPIFQPDNHSITCNYPGIPTNFSIPIRAGSTINAVYYYWLHTVGPMTAWLASCNGPCSTFDATQGKWFKIDQRGLLSGTITEGMWFQRQFQSWDGDGDIWPVTIPESLRPGEYLLRHEILSLHIANRPQFYPECAHLVVDGSGDKVPSEEYYARIPGVWSMDQPQINIDIYSDKNRNTTTYDIPGPPVWTG